MATINELVKLYYPNDSDVPLNELIRKIVETNFPQITRDKMDDVKRSIMSQIPKDVLETTPQTTIDQFVYLINTQIKKTYYSSNNNNIEAKASPTIRDILIKLSKNDDPLLDTTSDIFIQMTINEIIVGIMNSLKQNNLNGDYGDYVNNTYEELVNMITENILNMYNMYVSPSVITQLSDTVARVLSQKLTMPASLNTLNQNNNNNNNNNNNYIPVDISNTFNNTTLSISPAMTLNNNVIPVPKNSQNTKVEIYQSPDKTVNYYYLPEYKMFIPINKESKEKPYVAPTTNTTVTTTSNIHLNKLKEIDHKPNVDLELDSKVVDYIYDIATDDTAKKIIYLLSLGGIIALTIAILIVSFKN